MNTFQAIVLGIVQGLTEFLPVSSSGHLVLFGKLFKLEEPSMTFDIILHLGTLIPVFIVYSKDIMELIKKPFQKTTYLLFVATLPTIFVALFLGDYIDMLFETGKFISLGFIITGTILMLTDKAMMGSKKMPTYKNALFIGCMQAFAIIPAVSRSGSTIFGALKSGLTRKDAAKFSFLMSIPAILGATVYEAKDIIMGNTSIDTLPLIPTICGFLAAILAGYLSINLLVNVIVKAKLKYFAYYVYAIAFFILLDQFVFNIFF